MMNNEEFINLIRGSFQSYLMVGTSTSTAKLKSLHGYIAKDLQNLLGSDFLVKSQGYGDDKEGLLEGRYYPKKVDIVAYKYEQIMNKWSWSFGRSCWS